MSKLIMLGSDHRDPRLAERIIHGLCHFRPDLITVEYAGDDYVAHIKHVRPDFEALEVKARSLLSKRDITLREGVVTQLLDLYGAEHKSVKAYAEENGIPIVHTDSSQILISITNGILANLQGALEHSVEAISLFLQRLNTPYDDRAYGIFEQHFENPTDATFIALLAPQIRSIPLITPDREQHQSSTIMLALAEHQPKKPLHVGGIVHLTNIPDFATLYSLIRDTAGQRYSLRSIDTLPH